MIAITPGNEIEFKPEDIMYYGEHTCPNCGAEGTIDKYNTAYHAPNHFFPPNHSTTNMNAYLGYIVFACKNNCHSDKPEYIMVEHTRVCRLGSAMICIPFVTRKDTDIIHPNKKHEQVDLYLDAQRVRQAITFLGTHADPDKMNIDPITAQVILAMSGKITPDEATENIVAQNGTR